MNRSANTFFVFWNRTWPMILAKFWSKAHRAAFRRSSSSRSTSWGRHPQWLNEWSIKAGWNKPQIRLLNKGGTIKKSIIYYHYLGTTPLVHISYYHILSPWKSGADIFTFLRASWRPSRSQLSIEPVVPFQYTNIDMDNNSWMHIIVRMGNPVDFRLSDSQRILRSQKKINMTYDIWYDKHIHIYIYIHIYMYYR